MSPTHSCSDLSLNYTDISPDRNTIPIPAFCFQDTYPSLPHLHKSAASTGCGLCLLFIEAINKNAKKLLDGAGAGAAANVPVSLKDAQWVTENYNIGELDNDEDNGAHTLQMELEFRCGDESEPRGCSVYFSIHVDEGWLPVDWNGVVLLVGPALEQCSIADSTTHLQMI